MRRILTSLMFVASVYSFAQVGVSKNATDTPRATLDVRAMGETTPDGILIPNVDKGRAQNMTQPENSTLVYITNSGTGGARTVDVDADGFYYFKDTKWVKLGSGAASSTSASAGLLELGHVKGVLKVVSGPVPATVFEKGVFSVIATGDSNDITLPDPKLEENKYRILAIRNQSPTQRNFAGEYQPIDNSTLRQKRGILLQSDGSDWYVIAGF